VKIIKVLFCQCLVLTFVLPTFYAYAVSQSICHPGSNVVLHNNGSLKSCQLNNYYDANNIRCKSDGPVSFYHNGNLESCLLYSSVTIAQNKCKEDVLISFYIDGKLKACMKPDN